ncbi:MAG: excinuclease ABC subunit C, partial [Alphaproteobacteria bacterium]|nr:excinuclease ABC subunit C [Alphaproteobacteria bacterium]
GIRSDLIKFAENNVKDTFRKRYHYNKKHEKHFKEIAKLFKITQPINRIEIYDNSHFGGDQAVGVMVVCDKRGFNKSEYKKYKMRTLNHKPDDYEMFREMLSRRFKNTSNIPDLIIIDGGVGQVSVAKKTCSDLGLDEIAIVGMSKGPNRNSGEEVIHFSDGNSLFLDKYDKTKQYLQVLRDEAHRFAITFQRKSLEKKTIKSSLEDIEGVGPKRRRNLINYFGSLDKLKQASVEDIMRVDMVNRKNAEKIYKYFQKHL